MKKQFKKTPAVVVTVSKGMAAEKLKRWCALALAVFGLLLYVNTLGHDYTVDDGTVMQNNKIVKQGVKALPEIFTTAYRKGFWDRQESLYRPLSVAMFAVEWQLAPNNPLPGHVMNVLLYALTAYLLFQLLMQLFNDNLLMAFCIALLYIAHPLHTEVVANIKSRDEILCFLFVVLALRSFIFYVDKKSRQHLLVCSLYFLFALLSKESAITMVVVFPLVAYFFRKQPLLNGIKYSLVPGIAAVVYLLIRFSVLKGITNFTEILPINNSIVNADSYAIKFATALMILGKYLGLLIAPVSLSFDYSFNQLKNVGWTDGGFVVSLLVYAALLFYSLKEFKNRNGIAFGIIFFLITISIVSNVFFLIESVMAERFTYLPSLGICMAVVLLCGKLFRVKFKTAEKLQPNKVLGENKLFFIVIFSIAFLYSIKTIARNTEWKNNLTLLATDVKTSPESARIRYAYGSAILIEQALKEKDKNRKNNLLDKSIEQLERGVSILSTYSEAYYHLGLAYKERELYAKAVESFERAARNKTFTDPEFFVAWGVACGKAKKYEESIKALQHAADLNPKQTDAYLNMGVFYDEMNNFEASVKNLRQAIALDTMPDGAYYNLGNSYAHIGNYSEAIRHYKKSLELNAANEDAVNNIGNSYAAMKDYENAIVYFKKAIALNPANSKALNNLGITLIMTGKKEEGEAFIAKARQAGG